MISEFPLADRDLPSGHLDARATALVREISRHRSRPTRRAAALIVPVVIAIAATPALAFRQRLLDLFGDGEPVTSAAWIDGCSSEHSAPMEERFRSQATARSRSTS